MEEDRPDPYRLRVMIGDRVRMPDGRMGTVIDYDFPTAPNFLRVHVRPDKLTDGWRKILPAFTRRFVEREVDRLELIATKEELEALGPDA